MTNMKIRVHESKMSVGMARAILCGAVEGDKEDARRIMNRLYSEWVVKLKTNDGSPYTLNIVGAEDEEQAWKMALKSADRHGNGDLIDRTAPISIDYIQKWESKIREADAIPDKTLHTVLANLKCLGKPGKAVQNYPIKRRGEIFDEMEKRGWLEPDSMNLTDKGNEEAKKWVHLCQESKSSMTIKVHERWNPNADKHTRNEYLTEMRRIVNPLSKGIFHNTDWNAVWKIRDALKDAFPKVKFEMWADNRTGGYSGNTKTYDFSATTLEGYELFGRIKCFAAGTKEAPFDRYDMTVEIY